MGRIGLRWRVFPTVCLLLLVPGACATRNQQAARTQRVTDFGAACDGLRDDTRAIQRAFDAAASPPGQTVVLPEGVCLLSHGDADGAMLEIRGGTSVRGAGIGRTVLKVGDGWTGPAATDVVHTEHGGADIRIEGFTIDFNARSNEGRFAPTGLYGLAVRSSRTVVRDVEVLDSPANGMGVPTTGSGVRFERCVSRDNRLNGFYAGAVTDLQVVDSEAYGNTNGIALANGARDVVIAGSRFHDHTADGISIGDTERQRHRTDTRELIIADNRIHDNGGAGIGLIASRNPGADANVDAVLYRNEIHRNREAGISCNSARNVVVLDNDVRATRAPAILLLNGRDITIHRNTIVEDGDRAPLRSAGLVRIANNPDGPHPFAIGRIAIVGNQFRFAGGSAVSIDGYAVTDHIAVTANRLPPTGQAARIDGRTQVDGRIAVVN
jgi:hypothetical protein